MSKQGKAKKVWIIAVHGEASFKVVAVAHSEEDKEKVSKSFKGMGRILAWQADELEKLPME